MRRNSTEFFTSMLLVMVMIFTLMLSTTASAISYNPKIDYMSLMIKAAADGDIEQLEYAAECRNAKIEGMGLSYQPVSADQLLNDFEACTGFSLHKDYMAEMMKCCLNGDMSGGRDAAAKRNRKIIILGMSYPKWGFDDMFLLAKVIENEAGSSWLSQTWKMAVGEVVLNRVSSSKYPNTIYDVVYQSGQYAGVRSNRFANMLPSTGSASAAMSLVNGNRVFGDTSVLYQANFPQGYGTALRLYDSVLGSTYFCYG